MSALRDAPGVHLLRLMRHHGQCALTPTVLHFIQHLLERLVEAVPGAQQRQRRGLRGVERCLVLIWVEKLLKILEDAGHVAPLCWASVLKQRRHLCAHVAPGGEKHRMRQADCLVSTRQRLDDFKPRQAQRIVIERRPERILESPIRQLSLLPGCNVEEAPLHPAHHPNPGVRRARGNYGAPLCQTGVAHHRASVGDGAAFLVRKPLHHPPVPHLIAGALRVEIHVSPLKQLIRLASVDV
mmetsp:Transcript_32548/g.82141  ORF Transcript_32548/g.82141 Transcript_32548/m.82141 type:complete len:240 (-) Transcript_32548:125-844(-)